MDCCRGSVRTLDLFAGAGGLAYGFAESGLSFELVFAVEVDPAAARTFKRNFGCRVFDGPIEEIDEFEAPDVIVGGPPDREFSPLGRDRDDDSRAAQRFRFRSPSTRSDSVERMREMDAEKKDERRKPAVFDAGLSAGSSAAGAGLGAALAVSGSPLAAVVALAPAAIKFAVEQTMYIVSQKGKSRLVETAMAENGLTEQGLADVIRDGGPEVLPLTLEAFEASGRTLDERKIDALARVWAEGLSDKSKVDDNLLMVRSLAMLEAPHLQVLAILPLETEGEGLSPNKIGEELPRIGIPLLAVLGQLELAGFVAQGMGFWNGSHSYALSPWGVRAKEYLDSLPESGTTEQHE